MYEALKHIDYSASWGGYMAVDIHMDLLIQVNDEMNYITFSSSNVSGSRHDSYLDGYGFINYVALCWNLPYHYGEFADPDPSVSNAETYGNSWPEIPATASAIGISEGSLEGRTIWGTYASDNTSLSSYVSGYKGNPSSSFGRALTAADFDADGNIRNIQAVNAYRRWRDNGRNMACVAIGDSVYTLDMMEMDWTYYPWSLRKGGAWASCDRSGGSLKIRKGGAWRDAKNSLYATQGLKGFTRHGGAWVRTPISGNK